MSTWKGGSKVILAVAAVAVVAIVIMAYLVWPDDGGEEQGLVVGDYLKYQYDTETDDPVMWMNVTGVTDELYEFTIVLLHQNGDKETPDPFTVPNQGMVFWDPLNNDILNTENLVGNETLNTTLGDRTVNHYRVPGMYEERNFYIGMEYLVVYRAELIVDLEVVLSQELVETSIDWI